MGCIGGVEFVGICIECKLLIRGLIVGLDCFVGLCYVFFISYNLLCLF